MELLKTVLRNGGCKTFFKFSVLLVSILFSLVIASCAGGAGGGGSGAEETALSVTFPQTMATYTATDLASYSVTIESSKYTATKSGPAGGTITFTNIPVGTYKVTAYGKKADGSIAAKNNPNETSVTIEEGKTKTTVIRLHLLEYFTVTFKSKYDNSVITTKQVNSGEKATRPANPASPEAGLYFVNWYSDEDCTSIFNFNTAISADIEVYAKFGDAYTVTLNYNGGQDESGNTSSSDTYSYNDPVSEPTVTKTGYTHIGWATSADAPIEDVITSIPDVTGDATYYAKWQATQYIIHYNFTHAAQTTPADVVFFTIEDTPVSSSFPPIILNENYELKGWYDNASFSGTACPGVSIPAGTTGDVNYYAKVVLITEDITFDFNGGKNSANQTSTIVPTDRTQTPTAPSATDITRTGYTLLGWATSASATTALTSLPAVTGPATYYAVWRASYTITFNFNGGKNSSDETSKSVVVDAGDTPTAPAASSLSRTGYTCSGWGTSSTATTTTTISAATADRTYYAVWTPNTYTITYNNVGTGTKGTLPSNAITSYSYNATTSASLPTPTLITSDYTFDGWYTSSTFASGTKVTSTAGKTENLDLYARILFSATSFTGTVAEFEAIGEINPSMNTPTIHITGSASAADIASAISTVGADIKLDLSGVSGMTSIDDFSAAGTHLKQITGLPSGLQSIGKEAFDSCSALTGTVTLPANCTTVWKKAFPSGVTISSPNTLWTRYAAYNGSIISSTNDGAYDGPLTIDVIREAIDINGVTNNDYYMRAN